MTGDLLTPDFLAKIDQLELVSRKILAGKMRGERRSKRKGFSTEFADHRGYVVGDDLRFIDWNILIRLDRLFIKLFEEEEDLHFHLLIDTSKSMGFGEPTKLRFAKEVAAALSYIALVNLDRVMVSTFRDSLVGASQPARGRASVLRVLGEIERLTADGGSNLEQTCKAFAARNTGKGIVVVLSDLFDKTGFEAGLRYLVGGRYDVYVIHVLATEEVNPPVTGDLRLVDAEDGQVAEITVSAPLLARYRQTLDRFCDSVKDYCHRRGAAYLRATNDIPFQEFVLQYLRRRGLVR
jgi:uncharacterized protein (DUF58 family)